MTKATQVLPLPKTWSGIWARSYESWGYRSYNKTGNAAVFICRDMVIDIRPFKYLNESIHDFVDIYHERQNGEYETRIVNGYTPFEYVQAQSCHAPAYVAMSIYLSLYSEYVDVVKHTSYTEVIERKGGRRLFMCDPDENYQLKESYFNKPSAEFFADSNLEETRAHCEAFGWDKLGKLQLIDTAIQNGTPVQLFGLPTYNKEVGDIILVKVRCPSTGRIYHIPVPPETKTALSGVAWTFGMSETEYKPLIET